MAYFDEKDLKDLYIIPKSSHKGQNGKLTIIGGSMLFHGASLWALKIASRIVDMVFYASVPENNELTKYLEGNLYDFIAVPRTEVDSYVEESDAVLLGPGLPREEGTHQDEENTKELTKTLLEKYSHKKWVIDAGSLTEMNPDWLKAIPGRAILTPHKREFRSLFGAEPSEEAIAEKAKEYSCIILVKGVEDIVSDGERTVFIKGGNEGMTKGGTGDVLSGLVAALDCKNDSFLAACAGSFFNKKAGDELYERVGPYFNASDLCDEIPKVLNTLHR